MQEWSQVVFGTGGPRSEPTMPYVGVASFLKLPVGGPDGPGDLDFAVLGVPYDEGTSNRPGARYGPRGVRAASTLYSYEGSAELFDVEQGRMILEGARVADLGDVIIRPGDGEGNRERMAHAAAAIVEAGALPVTIGGDHSISASLLAGLREAGLHPHLVHLDTHMDFDSYLPAHAHGTPVRRSVEEGLVAGVTEIGIRGLNSGRDDWEEARRRGVEVVTTAAWRERGGEAVAALVPRDRSLYLSVDIDVFDPSVAPGTGTPEPGGVDYPMVRDLIRRLAARSPIVGVDLVEVNPLYDAGEMTATLAARLLLDVMDAAWQNRQTA